jgi:hypothetical protein
VQVRDCPKIKSWKALDWGVLALPDVFVLLEIKRLFVAVPEQKVYGRVKGIRLHDRFRIALEESVALVSEGIAMCGRLSRIKRNGRKVQC